MLLSQQRGASTKHDRKPQQTTQMKLSISTSTSYLRNVQSYRASTTPHLRQCCRRYVQSCGASTMLLSKQCGVSTKRNRKPL